MSYKNLFDSLMIIVSKLAVKFVSLRLDGLYVPATRLLFLCIVISILIISMSQGFLIFMVQFDNYKNIKSNSSPEFVSILFINF